MSSPKRRIAMRGVFDIDDDDHFEYQFMIHHEEVKKRQDDWVKRREQEQHFTHNQSKVRCKILVIEAYRLEKMHLEHQLAYCKSLIAQRNNNNNNNNSPNDKSNTSCESPSVVSCPCLKAPVFRRISPKYRVINLLLPHFEGQHIENTVAAIQRTFRTDNEMIEDLVYRYGPEPTELDPEIWLQCIQERRKNLMQKWTDILLDVNMEMRDRDNYKNVIRKLSIMRIFLQGAQADAYSCDSHDRGLREKIHLEVLEKVQSSGRLFISD
eukprot:Tbor_TRINITY_DN3968_c0_g1::TRINITY_DN3968_c0_g1_i1::g.828::m.828